VAIGLAKTHGTQKLAPTRLAAKAEAGKISDIYVATLIGQGAKPE
jgi:hypothetical protein